MCTGRLFRKPTSSTEPYRQKTKFLLGGNGQSKGTEAIKKTVWGSKLGPDQLVQAGLKKALGQVQLQVWSVAPSQAIWPAHAR